MGHVGFTWPKPVLPEVWLIINPGLWVELRCYARIFLIEGRNHGQSVVCIYMPLAAETQPDRYSFHTPNDHGTLQLEVISFFLVYHYTQVATIIFTSPYYITNSFKFSTSAHSDDSIRTCQCVTKTGSVDDSNATSGCCNKWEEKHPSIVWYSALDDKVCLSYFIYKLTKIYLLRR